MPARMPSACTLGQAIVVLALFGSLAQTQAHPLALHSPQQQVARTGSLRAAPADPLTTTQTATATSDKSPLPVPHPLRLSHGLLHASQGADQQQHFPATIQADDGGDARLPQPPLPNPSLRATGDLPSFAGSSGLADTPDTHPPPASHARHNLHQRRVGRRLLQEEEDAGDADDDARSPTEATGGGGGAAGQELVPLEEMVQRGRCKVGAPMKELGIDPAPPSTAEERAARRGLVVFHCRGRFGNYLGEYVIARLLAEHLNFGLQVCDKFLHFLFHKGNVFPNLTPLAFDPERMAGLPEVKYKTHGYPLARIFNDSTPRIIHLAGYPFLDVAPFRIHKADIVQRHLKIDLSCLRWEQPVPRPRDVVVHIRAYHGCSDAEQPVFDPRGHFVDLPYEHFQRILDRMRAPKAEGGGGGWDRLWIVSPCGTDHDVGARLRDDYGAQALPPPPHVAMMQDFLFMTQAKRIIMSQSTFAWWAAYLSAADEIHYPLVGEWWGNLPRHMLYPDEPRYVFHDLYSSRFFLKYPDIGTPKKIRELAQIAVTEPYSAVLSR